MLAGNIAPRGFNVKLTNYRIWNLLVNAVDDASLYRIASADSYAGDGEWKTNYEILREIVKTGILPAQLAFSVAEGATFFNIGFAFPNSEAAAQSRDSANATRLTSIWCV